MFDIRCQQFYIQIHARALQYKLMKIMEIQTDEHVNN